MGDEKEEDEGGRGRGELDRRVGSHSSLVLEGSVHRFQPVSSLLPPPSSLLPPRSPSARRPTNLRSVVDTRESIVDSRGSTI